MEYGIREVGERVEVPFSPSETREILTGDSHRTETNDCPNQTILITGGTGSLGKHLCKILLEKYHPLAIRVYSRDELKQHEMRQIFGDEKIRYFIGDVRDGNRLKRAMEGADMSFTPPP
jgi:UDP-N-acetylglucosamine 4,6-dehydratase